MKTITQYGLALLIAVSLIGCGRPSARTASVVDPIRRSLDQAGYNDVQVDQDREKGVVTLRGHVSTEGDKSQAEELARAIAGPQVVSNEIGVIPRGAESEAKDMNAEFDEAISHNLEAVLIAERLHDDVHYAVKNHVVTLTGSVNSQTKRAHAESVALRVPHVNQVVNELQVKDQRATESK